MNKKDNNKKIKLIQVMEHHQQQYSNTNNGTKENRKQQTRYIYNLNRTTSPAVPPLNVKEQEDKPSLDDEVTTMRSGFATRYNDSAIPVVLVVIIKMMIIIIITSMVMRKFHF